MKLMKATISGSYRTSTGEYVDFDDVEGFLPFVDEDVAAMHIRGRYAVMWVKAATDSKGEKKYPLRVQNMRQVFIDRLETVEGDNLSFIGKDIKEMGYEELQDLATFKDLRRIPLPKELSGVSLRDMRAKAYVSYVEEVLMKEAPSEAEMARFGDLPPVFVEGGYRRDETVKLTNEEVIEREASPRNLGESAKQSMTIDELKDLARQKHIPFHPNIGFDKLYEKIYGVAA